MAGLGIYHYGARFYSPKLGRFLSADTIVPSYANPQNLNRFSYVTNNPLRYTDPTGHEPKYGCYDSTNGVCTNANGTSLSAGNGLKKPKKDKDNEPGGTPPSPTSTPCFVVSIACSHPTSTSTPYPTLTPTPGCDWTITNCFGATPTPFLQDHVPAIEDGINILNPLSVSFEPDVATWFWDTLLGAAPVLGLPASSLHQVIDTVLSPVVNVITNGVNTLSGFVLSRAPAPIFFSPSIFPPLYSTGSS